MSDLLAGLRAYAVHQLPRVLTQMDRDPDSPTFGCFDRDHWHYKMRDFPSAILQQGLFTLEALRRGALPWEGDRDLLDRWAAGALAALGRQVGRDGGLDEYYPYERGFPPAAFGLWAAARVLAAWQADAPALFARVDLAPFGRLVRHLARRAESEALNQHAAALAGLAWAARLPGLDPGSLERHASHLFAAQHPEGWFPEYGGPDFGYLTVTLDALADYHDATGDPRALAAADRAVAFLAGLVGADGRLPSTLNSRNTDYVVPYGLVRAGARNPVASWLVHTLFRDAADPRSFLWATDDRYHCHYIYASCVRSLEHLPAMLPPEEPPRPSLWLDGCGYWVRWAEDRSWTAYAAARKGGLVRIHRRGEPPLADHGWRVRTGGRLWTSNWWSGEWRAEAGKGSLTVSGACQEVAHLVPRPWQHAALRLAAWTLRRRLVPLLKKALIFRPRRMTGPAFERRVTAGPGGVEVRDRIALPPGGEAVRAPRQNPRHVASADSFSPEELLPSPGGPAQAAGDGLTAVWRWPGEGA